MKELVEYIVVKNDNRKATESELSDLLAEFFPVLAAHSAEVPEKCASEILDAWGRDDFDSTLQNLMGVMVESNHDLNTGVAH